MPGRKPVLDAGVAGGDPEAEAEVDARLAQAAGGEHGPAPGREPAEEDGARRELRGRRGASGEPGRAAATGGGSTTVGAPGSSSAMSWRSGTNS